ncbi:MAG: ion transporter [Bacteroidaceae bacterium]|nr:ion transporter [Bacteroidaceae bacterium]
MLNWMKKAEMYRIIFGADTKAGKAFDVVVMVAILLSLPLIFVESLPDLSPTIKEALTILEYILTAFFTLEYIARVYCSPVKRRYIFSFFGIIDFLATFPPYVFFFIPAARYLILFRTFRLTRVFRVFKLFSFINEGYLLMESLRKSLKKILVYFIFVLILVTCLGTLMYIIEQGQPGTNFTDVGTSIYWAIVTMTTVGYGDITPVTFMGRLLAAFIMLLGYTIIAVPTGIVSATFIDETQKRVRKGRCPRCEAKVGKGDHYCANCGEKL